MGFEFGVWCWIARVRFAEYIIWVLRNKQKSILYWMTGTNRRVINKR